MADEHQDTPLLAVTFYNDSSAFEERLQTTKYAWAGRSNRQDIWTGNQEEIKHKYKIQMAT